MSVENSRKKEKREEGIKQPERRQRCTMAARFLTGAWAFLMLAVFPYYMKNHYSRLGVRKFEFFFYVSIGLLIPAACIALMGKAREKKSVGKLFSPLDSAMLLYLLSVTLSWCLSVDRTQAWIGADGWFMGLRTQLLLVLAYFMVSRYLPVLLKSMLSGRFSWEKILLAAHFLGSGGVFVLGILHRFRIDPLGLYEGIGSSYQLLFLSTMGQASWYSSYVCTVLVVSAAIFFFSEKPVFRLAAGIHCMLGFSTVVTQNSDSAFAAMAFLLFGLFLCACDSMDQMEHFFETVILMLGSFKIMGILQQVFYTRAVQLDGLSVFLAQSTWTWLVFLAVCLSYMAFLFYRQRHPEVQELAAGRVLRRVSVCLAAAVLAMYILFLWLNTAGYLEAWTGTKVQHGYLLFDDAWGNSRGFIWRFAGSAFAAFPFIRKLFGVGPDCFSAYCYSDTQLTAQLDHFFGHDQTLANAHNEFLNALFCLGILGFIAFAAIFAVAFLRFFQKRKEEPMAVMGMLAVLAYGAHNFFCYQQVCCTPFLFLILGIAENFVRNTQKAAKEDEG